MASYDVVDFQGLETSTCADPERSWLDGEEIEVREGLAEGRVKKVRKALGARAFGVNFFDLPPGSDGHEHDETVRVHPVVGRKPIAGDEGLAWVAIGAPRDGRYEPPDWG